MYAGSDPINLYDPTGLDTITTIFNFPCSVGAGEGQQTVACELYTFSTTHISADPPALTSRQIVARAEQLAKKWLKNTSCQNLFNTAGNGFDPQQVLTSLVGSGSFTSGFTQIRLFTVPFVVSADVLGAVTWPNRSPPWLGLGADIFLNTNGLSTGDGDDDANTVAETAEAILEELGHAYNFAAGSGGSSIVYDNPFFAPSYTDPVAGGQVSAGQYNYLLIMRNCKK